MDFGTLGHYAINSVNGANDKIVAWLVERDPDGMSVAEIDAQLARLSTLSVEVSKAHTKSDQGKVAYEAAASRNAIRLRTAETAQGKIEKMPAGPDRSSKEAELATYLETLEGDQAELESLKKVYESALQFYQYLDKLFNTKGDNLRSMKAKLATATNTMKSAKAREDQLKEQEKVAKAVVGGSHGVDKFEVAMGAIQKATNAANERAEASQRIVDKLTAPTNPAGGFMADIEAEAAGQHAPPAATVDRIAALKARAA